MMTVQKDMWNSFQKGTSSVACFSVQTPCAADVFRSGNCAGCQGQTNISSGGQLLWVAFSNWKEPTTTTIATSLTTTLPRPLPPLTLFPQGFQLSFDESITSLSIWPNFFVFISVQKWRFVLNCIQVKMLLGSCLVGLCWIIGCTGSRFEGSQSFVALTVLPFWDI